jgi:hypothetical protein
MKIRSFKKFLILLVIPVLASCAMAFNGDTVDVTINSNPQGADIFINGMSYGKTPKTINIKPENYTLILNKEGYGTAQIQLESWVAIRNKKGDGGRCLADALGSMLVVPLYSFYWSGKCLDFKQSEYMINIPYSGSQQGQNNNSMMRIGKSQSETVPYYYNQNYYNQNSTGSYRQ